MNQTNKNRLLAICPGKLTSNLHQKQVNKHFDSIIATVVIDVNLDKERELRQLIVQHTINDIKTTLLLNRNKKIAAEIKRLKYELYREF